MGYTNFSFILPFRLSCSIALLMLILMVSASSQAADGLGKRIMVIYGPGGHQTAAQSIGYEMSQADPSAEVLLSDFAVQGGAATSFAANTIHPFVMRNFPSLLAVNQGFRLALGRFVQTLPNLLYEPQTLGVQAKVLATIEREKPDVIISAHYYYTGVLGVLRRKGLLRNIPIAWIHTDMVPAEMYAKLSLPIDMTFLPHSSLHRDWLNRGIEPQRVMATGMAIRRASMKVLPFPSESDPKTITIIGGSFGGIDFESYVRQLYRAGTGKLRINAVTGLNTEQFEKLQRLKGEVSDRIELFPYPKVAQPELFKMYEASHLIVSKPGGLSTFELLFANRPVILFNLIDGQEGYNAEYMSKVGAAEVTRTMEATVSATTRLLVSPDAKDRFIKAQSVERAEIRPQLIAQWALQAKVLDIQMEGYRSAPDGFANPDFFGNSVCSSYAMGD